MKEEMITISQKEKTIAELLEEADQDWFSHHSMTYAYGDHIKFVASFVARRYDTRLKHLLSKEATREKRPRPIAPARVKSPTQPTRRTNKGPNSAKPGRRGNEGNRVRPQRANYR